MSLPRSILYTVSLIALSAGTFSAQTASLPDREAPAATLKMDVRTVVEDVVVQDKRGHVISGLRKEDFQVFENGKPQAITFFEPNFGETATGAPVVALPPDTFTNVPAVAPNQAVNILLMDALNTPAADQIYVRLQMVKYLALLPPNIRVGIFMLGEKLRLVQGFTQDSTILRAAIARFAAKPSPSILLPTLAQKQAQKSLVDMMEQMAATTGSSQMQESATALRDFMQREGDVEGRQELLITLNALQVLAHYLGGIPGRKNLIWFVGDLPVCLPIEDCPYQDLYHETQNMLAAARVSVYPIDAGGVVAPNSDIGGPSQSPPTSDAPLAGAAPTSAPGETLRPLTDPLRFINSETWAENTGGKAFHDNDLKQELADAIDHGSRYYTMAYVPTDSQEEGRERKIAVKTPSRKCTLFYRRRYFEQTPKQIEAARSAPVQDPLRPLMDRGMPNATDIPFQLSVFPSAIQPGAAAAHAGENPQLAGKLTRYKVGFQLQAASLSLVPGPDGDRLRLLEVVLLVYDHDGKQLNWATINVNILIKPQQWPKARKSGVPFYFEIDAPQGDVYLRTGIYDRTSNKAGTLEIPLSAVAVAQK